MRVRVADLPTVAVAATELLVARLKLATLPAQRLMADITVEHTDPPTESRTPLPLITKVAHFIPRVAARLPWRADCLVQALAARRWLARHGIATELHLGVRPSDTPFEAHAWLQWHEHVVTGGTAESYSPLRRSRSGE